MTTRDEDKGRFLKIIERLGLVINPAKSSQELTSQVDWLGHTFDLAQFTVSVQAARVASFKRTVGTAVNSERRGPVHVKTLAKTIGVVQAQSLAVPNTRPLYRYLPHDRRTWTRRTVQHIAADIIDPTTALTLFHQAQPRQLTCLGDEVDIEIVSPEIYTDASTFAMSCVFREPAHDPVTTSYAVPWDAAREPIRVKELLTVLFALRRHALEFRRKTVKV